MEPTIVLTNSERVWVGELLTKLKFEAGRALEMLSEAVESGETTPDNENIAEHKRVLGYLKPLLKKIRIGEGDLELTAVEAGQLEKLLRDAENWFYSLEGECAAEVEEAQEEGLDTAS